MRSLTSVQVAIGAWALLVLAAGIYNLTHRAPEEAVEPLQGSLSTDEQPVVIEEEMLVPCTPFPSVAGDKTVVLRVDDVQSFAWPSTTRAMIVDAETRNIPLTLGVIPKNFSGDTELVSFLKQRECNHEFALHGFDHASKGANEEYAEFELLEKEAALLRLSHGLEELRFVTDKDVNTWIPPLNRHSTGTQEALTELGVTRWSTEGKATWDYDASTFSYTTNALADTDQVIADCVTAFEDGDVCIVMLHPQDFTTDNYHDEAKYQVHYLDMIDRLLAKGYGFGTFEDVDA